MDSTVPAELTGSDLSSLNEMIKASPWAQHDFLLAVEGYGPVQRMFFLTAPPGGWQLLKAPTRNEDTQKTSRVKTTF